MQTVAEKIKSFSYSLRQKSAKMMTQNCSPLYIADVQKRLLMIYYGVAVGFRPA